MKIYTNGTPIVLENTGDTGHYFSLNVFPNNNTKYIGFQLVFPDDCIVERYSDNSVIIWRKRPETEE
jgi:hypothetical protein